MPSLSSVPVFSTEGVVDSWRVSMLCAGAVVMPLAPQWSVKIARSLPPVGGRRADEYQKWPL